ncbi:hypothetical protein GCM10023149_08130 [Mucilaginibacter gynuensis]|uniref:Uncharacterized protein n=2 Tax=Mucilaginibacter gynuensis TaxID=1302236 RepID=A0ABP8FWY7_9SPHI
MQASAQKSLVTSALSKYGLDQSFLDAANLRAPVDHAFDLKESTTVAGKTKVILAKFEPSATEHERWKVVSVDGKSPSLYETNTFRNARAKPPVDKPDETTYKIDSETTDQMVISYKMDAASIPKEASFLKDCRVILSIDLKNKQLTQLQLLNEKPVKIGPLTANKFEIVTKYFYDKLTKRYFPLNDNVHMDAAFLGKTVTTQIETVYSNYTKGR